MTLWEECQVWHENDDFQKVIDAIEAIPADRRTPELDSELARAYNNLAAPGDRKLYEKAIALLERHKEYFYGDYYWNFRMGYAYYYMDQEGTALHYFEQALKARPDDQDTQELFEKNFRERTEHAWAAFLEIEGTLIRLLPHWVMPSVLGCEKGLSQCWWLWMKPCGSAY